MSKRIVEKVPEKIVPVEPHPEILDLEQSPSLMDSPDEVLILCRFKDGQWSLDFLGNKEIVITRSWFNRLIRGLTFKYNDYLRLKMRDSRLAKQEGMGQPVSQENLSEILA